MKWFWTLFLAVAVFGGIFADYKSRRPGGPSNPTGVDKSASSQSTRDSIIEKGIELGLIQKLEVREAAVDLWTGPMWSGSDFDVKQNAVNTVHARHLADAYNGVNIIDGRTGKRIGRFVPALGGLKLD